MPQETQERRFLNGFSYGSEGRIFSELVPRCGDVGSWSLHSIVNLSRLTVLFRK